MSRQGILLGVLAAVLVIALWWLFLFSPGQERLAEVEGEIEAAEGEQASLEQRIATLEAVRARAPETEAAIARVQSIVPADPALAAALRQIVASADDAGVDIDSLTTPRPETSGEGEAISLFRQGISMAATGSYFQLVDFVRRIEDPEITSRGILFDSMSIAVSDYPDLTVSLSGRMFSVLDPPPEPDGEADVGGAPDEDAEAEADDGGDEGDVS